MFRAWEKNKKAEIVKYCEKFGIKKPSDNKLIMQVRKHAPWIGTGKKSKNENYTRIYTGVMFKYSDEKIEQEIKNFEILNCGTLSKKNVPQPPTGENKQEILNCGTLEANCLKKQKEVEKVSKRNNGETTCHKVAKKTDSTGEKNLD